MSDINWQIQARTWQQSCYFRSITPISIKFVPVTPVRINPPYFLKKPYELFLSRYGCILPIFMSDCQIAPAQFVTPSMPSVPTDTTTAFFFFLDKSVIQCKTNS